MADRQQNINILFKTNTVDLEKATLLLNKAKAANDALNQSANKFGQESAQSAQRFSSTIAGLTLQMQQLKAQIDLTNQSDKTRLDGLTNQYRQMSAQLEQYKANLKLTDDSIKSTTQSLSGLYNMVRLALTAGIVKEAASAVIGMAALQGQVEGVRRAFAKLPESAKLMVDLREKTHGTIDELTLMQKAVQAKNFKIPLEQLGNLLEFAAVKAQQTGLDINYLVDSLITGLGRNSIKILDNLQFSVTELRAKTKELGSTQAAVFYLVNKQMQDMGGYIETAETKTKKLTTAWTNFKIAISESGAGKAGVAVAQGFTNFLDRWTEALGGKSADPMRNLRISLDLLNDAVKNNRLNGENGIIKGLENAQKFAAEAGVELIKLTDGIKVMYAIKPNPVNIITSKPAAEEQIGILKDLTNQIDVLNQEIIDSTDASGKEQRAKIAERQELERLVKVYSLSDKELTDYLESLDKGKMKSIQFADAVKQLADRIAGDLKRATNNSATGAIRPITDPSTGQPITSSTGSTNTPANNLKTWYDQYATFWDKVGMGFDDLGKRIRRDGQLTTEDQRRAYQQLARDTVNALQSIAVSQAQSILQADVDSYDARIKASQDYYDRQIELAGDNSAAVKALKKKENDEVARLEKEKSEAAKKAALTGIIINTALGIAKALASSFFPINIGEAAIVAAEGASQYAIASRAKYAKGVIDLKGPGTGTSDSIPSMLSKGESVMTAEETRANIGILKAIRAKSINDKVLSDIIAKNGGSQAQPFNDKNIIKAIEKIQKDDLVKRGSLLFEAKRDNENHVKYVRSKYLG